MSTSFIPTNEASSQTGNSNSYVPPLDLQRELIPRPASTFLLISDAKQGKINPGDILIVDRSITPTKERMVIAEQEGDLRLARYPVAEVWGVVTHVIHKT